MPNPQTARGPARDRSAFLALQKHFPSIWTAIQHQPSWEHTSVVVPSLSLNQEELSKVQGASFYEERLLFSLIRLRNPRAHVIYVTSHPVHPDIVDYYLQLLPGVPSGHARQRLHLLSVYDSSPKALTQKILERPRVLDRLRRFIGDPRRAYLTCYNVTELEEALAVELRIPLNGVDPELLWLGTKTGSRRVFAEAGVAFPDGAEDLRSESDLLGALEALTRRGPVRRAVVKLNEGFSGEGNGLVDLPAEVPAGAAGHEALTEALQNTRWSAAQETYPAFLRKLSQMGGVVEQFIEGTEVRSPSVQMRIHPDGKPILLSSHDQILGGSTGQVYLGCKFPADDAYRALIQRDAMKIGQVLARYGVISRFGIDFLLVREPGADWKAHAIEINLRMGG
ncbi:MAG: carboxylate-amine ligase, partial [Candidatus Eisenbacteria bacterium]|nr:carboxylate-amine ligase [Candidatus Eisenbacteria bacterium]